MGRLSKSNEDENVPHLTLGGTRTGLSPGVILRRAAPGAICAQPARPDHAHRTGDNDEILITLACGVVDLFLVATSIFADGTASLVADMRQGCVSIFTDE